LVLDGDISHLCFGDISYIEQALQFLEGRSGMEAATPPAAEDEKTDPMIGRTVSHYRVSEKLGEGGMGVVYKAEDTKLKRVVALKFFSTQTLGTEEEKIRFVREAQAAAALDHPNVCTIHEIESFGDQTFIAMAYIDGKSLEKKLESGPFDVGEALDIAIQVAEGLQEAHEKGVVHRDIKAANIMVTSKGHARIMDFGLAKLTGQTRLTKTATIMGTVAYMSPEQAHGETTIDHRTDVWSLGVVLYEMLTGKPPFDAPTDAGLIYKIVHEDPEPLTDLRSEIPASLGQAVLKMLQKDPRDRYENMGALISDLKSIRSGATPTIVLEDKPAPSIAVLPFVDMSPQKDQEYLCDGISESLINALTQLGDLRVIARTSAFSFKGQSLDVREIGKKLNVRTVLEGSVQKAGNKVRVTAQLVNTAGGQHLWSEKYDRDMQDIFAIQDEISDAIVDKLKPKLFGEKKARLTKREAVDIEVYDLYLRGRWFWNKRTAEGLKRSIEYYERAIERDPDYALAYVGLADACLVLPTWTPRGARHSYLKGKELALKALEIDEGLAEAHTSLAFFTAVCDHEWERAVTGYKRAIELNPGYTLAHSWYAILLSWIGRFEEAIKETRQALELDPLSLAANFYAGVVLLNAREYDRAIEMLQKTIELDPHFPLTRALLGKTYQGKSMYEEALAEYQREDVVGGSFLPAASTGVVYVRIGERDKALHVLEDLLRQSKEQYVSPYGLATLCFALGDNDKGFELLEKAYGELNLMMCFMKVDADLDAIRSDPRYLAMLRKMNLDE
ncbi:MAG: protein kinase, partial [Candidatus Hydrogenedentota bacterium]